MIRAVSLLASVLLATAPAFAGGSGLQSMATADDSRGFEGVGRINVGGRSFCTGALVADNLVLTAGHCLYDHEKDSLATPDEVEFLAGWRDGRAAAYRGARRFVVHPGYIENGSDRSVDLALIELDQPIRNTTVLPFDTGARAMLAREVGVVSYAHDRAETPSMQNICHVLGKTRGTLVLDCDVDFGSSGAPVFDLSEGTPRIVSVVSAKGMVGDLEVSLGTSLVEPLDDLRHLLKDGADGVFGQNELRPAGFASAAGAKFVRP